ncbi:MAG: gluconolaconase, partial [Candidatus Eremiobacteraeota bacterium]|nr:gluconolaconase [Candidatus Eremiobacteraeota bacterium]
GIARLGTYLNDVRIDTDKQIAYITDSATITNSALIVVDLRSGKKRRRLDGHPTVQPAPLFTPFIEERPLRLELPLWLTFPYKNGADGIALSRDRKTLYYCPLSSNQLYSVSAEALADPALGDDEIRRTIVHLGTKGFSDGLECDAEGRLYASDLENHRILRSADGRNWEVFVDDPRMTWTDTLSVAADGYLYFTANQINRLAVFNGGKDRRQPPYFLLKSAI